MTTTLNRRALVKGAAWSVPVIALAAAAPQAAASTTAPPLPAFTKCERREKQVWRIHFADSSYVDVEQGVAMSHPVWGPECRKLGSNPGAGK